jgi:eukaryotic-like serine/threonine-protein kinase
LARAAPLTGDVARNRKAYQSFLELWKDADAEIPILKTVRREYESMKKSF